MTIWVPGKLTNPLNGSWGFWLKHARIARSWRHRTALAVYTACGRKIPAALHPPERPKVVTFTVLTGAPWDCDALPGAVKPVRDELVKCGLLHSDDPASGHVFVYRQRVDRGHRGVEITVEVIRTTGGE